MKDKTYRYFQGPGHGWIEVPTADLVALGVDQGVSHYSYQKRSMAYLEEDCDAPLFIKAFQAKYGKKPHILEIYQDPTPIRDYQNYRPPEFTYTEQDKHDFDMACLIG